MGGGRRGRGRRIERILKGLDPLVTDVGEAFPSFCCSAPGSVGDRTRGDLTMSSWPEEQQQSWDVWMDKKGAVTSRVITVGRQVIDV